MCVCLIFLFSLNCISPCNYLEIIPVVIYDIQRSHYLWQHSSLRLWQAVLTFIHFQDTNSWYQELHFLISRIQLLISKIEFLISKTEFLISTIVFSLVKCHHRLSFKTLLISRIDFLLVEIPISHITYHTIITSKNLYFWYQEFNCY